MVPGYRFLYLLSDDSEVQVDLPGTADYAPTARSARKMAEACAGEREEKIDRLICVERIEFRGKSKVEYIPAYLEEEVA